MAASETAGTGALTTIGSVARRVFIAGIAHETNTYASGMTAPDDFEQWRGEGVLRQYGGTRTYPGGLLDGAREIGAEPVCGLVAFAQPSGIISAAAYDAMREELLSGLSEAGAVDAVALTLHGAAIAQGLDDLEGDLVAAVRAHVGPHIPIVVTLDLHGNITQAMADAADAIFGCEQYPHIDMYERGVEAMLLLPALWGGVKPATHVERLPMLLPTTTTFHGPMAEVNRALRALEATPGVIDVTLFHGFPYTDIPGTGAFVTATTEGDRRLARRLAVEAAELVWARRDAFLPASVGPAEAIRRALAVEGRPVVINETSDNTGGGTPGDGTHLLRAMLEANLDDAAFGFIVDPEVAAQAHRAGAGASITVRLGGKTDELHGAPIDAEAYVKTLADGRFRLTSPMGAGEESNLGRTARLVIGGIDVIVGSRRSQTFDEEVFLLHGVDVRRKKVVALKSSQHFRAGFEPIAAGIVTADSPGLTTLRLEVFARERTPRPIWPLDPDARYRPSLESTATA